MNATKEKVALGARTGHVSQIQCEENHDVAAPSSECGKAAAFALYNFGILPIESVERLFRRHPEWTDA
jgi:hypothetical protein